MLFLSTISLDHPDSYQVVPDIFFALQMEFYAACLHYFILNGMRNFVNDNYVYF